jgi:hypothetical protein
VRKTATIVRDDRLGGFAFAEHDLGMAAALSAVEIESHTGNGRFRHRRSRDRI